MIFATFRTTCHRLTGHTWRRADSGQAARSAPIYRAQGHADIRHARARVLLGVSAWLRAGTKAHGRPFIDDGRQPWRNMPGRSPGGNGKQPRSFGTFLSSTQFSFRYQEKANVAAQFPEKGSRSSPV